MLQTIGVYAAVLGVVFGSGVMLSQRIKDWLAGVPVSVRADLSSVEASLLAKLKTVQASIVADFKAKVTPPTPVLQTSVTAAVTGPTGPAA